MRKIGLLLMMFSLTGCAGGGLPFFTKSAETISVPTVQARNVYATIRTYYLDWKAKADARCQKNEMPAAECVKLAAAHEQFKSLDFEIRRALDNPGVDMNWENIGKVLSLAGGLVP